MGTIKYTLGFFLLGIIVGAAFMLGVQWNREAEADLRANVLVDFVISQWTGVDPSDRFPTGSFGNDSTQKSQLSASKELPTARLGFFPDTVRSLAEMVQNRYGVPAAVTMAQWALESSWGKNNLGVSNYFGHTSGATKQFSLLKRSVTRTETIGNKRTLQFTVYKNIEECFDVHGKYLSTSKHYRGAFYTNSAENFVRALSVYAEDKDYATKLITIIRRYHL